MSSKSVHAVASVDALRDKGWEPRSHDGGVGRLLDALAPEDVPAHKRPGNAKLRRERRRHPGRTARRNGW